MLFEVDVVDDGLAPGPVEWLAELHRVSFRS